MPTAFVGAGYLVAGGHWYVFKAALAAQGIPAEIAALAAPAVAILAVLGIRHVVRLAFSPPETTTDVEGE